MAQLTRDNFAQGFLVDEELMAGVTEHPDQPGKFAAYVLSHATGEYLGFQPYENLDLALSAINAVQRDWTFEKTSGGCGGGNCGKSGGAGGCKGGGCGKSKKATAYPEASAEPDCCAT